jgi:uncharacterized protein YqhQ
MSKGTKNKSGKKSRCFSGVGGQALMEGIMMTGPKGTVMSLRMPDGSIQTTPKSFKKLKDKHKIFGKPFIRGPVSFVESMIFGYKCLMESAEKTSIDLETEEESTSKVDKWLIDHFGPKMMAVIGVIAAVLGFLLSFGLFIYLPSLIFDEVLVRFTGIGNIWRPLIEGVIKVIIFIVYMAAVSNMKEMKRLFMYHGAEHKSIFCIESDEELTVDNVRKQSRFHPRCGTSFIFVIIIISITVASLISVVFAGTAVTEIRALWVLLKLLMLPFIMSIGFEFLMYAGKHDNPVVSVLAAPGLWMQRITTKEPTDDIIEVGIAAIKAVIDEPETKQNTADEGGAAAAVPEDKAAAEEETPGDEKADGESRGRHDA